MELPFSFDSTSRILFSGCSRVSAIKSVNSRDASIASETRVQSLRRLNAQKQHNTVYMDLVSSVFNQSVISIISMLRNARHATGSCSVTTETTTSSALDFSSKKN